MSRAASNVPLAAAPGTTHLTPATVAPGVTISNLRGLLDKHAPGRNTSGMGTLGFLALVNGTRDRIPVLVSNRHVLLANNAPPSAAIYQPALQYDEDQRAAVRGDTLESIAELLDPGLEGNHRFQYPDEVPADYFVDCASARILQNVNTVSTFLRVIDGMATRVAVAGVARLHPLDAIGWRSPRVRKFGGASGLTTGRVVDARTRVTVAGAERLNTIAIRGDSGPFVGPGDSGALLLNERNEAIGLVWGRSDTDPRVAYASHIHPVLDRLGVTMMAGGRA
jgi:hypothetical protein